MLMPGCSESCMCITSRGLFNAMPRMSNPHTILATVAGQRTLTDLINKMLYSRCANDICKHAGCCYFCAGPGAFYHQWLIGIAVGIEKHYVIFPIQMIEAM